MLQKSVASDFESQKLAIEDPKPEVPQMLVNFGTHNLLFVDLYDLIVFPGFFSRYHFHPFKMVFYRIPTVFYRYYFHRWPPGGLTRQP